MFKAPSYLSGMPEPPPSPPSSFPPSIPAIPPSMSVTSLASTLTTASLASSSVPLHPLCSMTPSSETSGASSLLATLSQFFESGSIVLRQLRRMESAFHDMPSVFQGVRTRFPLMLDLVKKIMLQLDAGMVSEQTQDVMLPVARSCVKHAQMMSELVNKTAAGQAPSQNSSREGTWPRGRRGAMLHAEIEPEVARIDAVLKANFDVLAQAGTFQPTRAAAASTFHMGGPVAMMQPEVYAPAPLHAALRSATFHGGAERRSTFQPSTPAAGIPPPIPPLSLMHSVSLTSVPTMPPTISPRGSMGPGVGNFDRRRSITPTNSVFMVPFPRDYNFVGRNEILRSIDEKYMEQTCVALTGLGGVGKTQIVIEYAYIFRERNPKAHVFWVYGNTSARFEESYEEIARRLQLPGWDEPTIDNMQLVYDWFDDGNAEEFDEEDDSAHWLFILDNADDASTFYPPKGANDGGQGTQRKAYAKYLPVNSTGAVLLTTRDRRVGERLSGRTRALEVGSMTAEESKELLRSKVAEDNWDGDQGLKLCEELIFLPLAITQAAAFISENNITVSEYLEMLFAGDEDIKELLSEHLEDSRREFDTENSVMRTWKLSFDHISNGMPRAAEILSLLAVMDYHNVNQSLLRREKESEMGFKSGLGVLQAFHLITVGRGKHGVCKMHRLVALSTQKWLEVRGKLDDCRAEALSVIERKFPGKQNFSDWAKYESLTPHARLMFSYEFTKPDDLLKKAKLLVAATLYNLSKGRYLEAYNMSSKALEIRQELLPADDPVTLDSVQTVGECLLHRGELKRARTMLERAVAGREKSLGPEEPDTLESLSDLTITLLELGDNDAAEVTATKALNGRQKVLGPDHSDTLVSQNIIAILLHRQGKLEDARTLCETVLGRRELLLGQEHPDTIMTRSNLSRLYADLGEYSQAGPLMERVVAEEDKVLGAEGCDIQVTMSNAALVKAEEGDFDAAEGLIKRVLEMRERLLGKEHPSALWSLGMLAGILRRAGRVDEARRWERMVARRTKPRVEEMGELLKAGLLFD